MKTKTLFLVLLVSCHLFWVSTAYLSAQSPGSSSAPPEAQGPEAVVPGAVTTSLEESVTVDYKDAEIANVLRSLAYAYNLNLVTPQDMKGKVTLSLVGVSVDEALSAILGLNDYTFTRKGNLIYITEGPGLESIGVVTERVPLRFLVAADASTLLQKVISAKGDMRVNEATNSLVITDFPSSLERVKKVLQDIDVAPIQVLIEAKLVDITDKDFENFGVTYSIDYKPKSGGLFGRDTSFQEELAATTNMAGPSATLSGGQMKFTAITFKNVSGSVTLDALVQQNKAHVLASPSIATLNGKEARIIIGERFPYKEKLQTTTGTIESTRFADIGTTLRVIPRVSPDGWITMVVHPEVSSLTAALDAGPRISTREADATIRVKDGETFVIGGLIRREDSRNKGKMPLLGDIPLLGNLFRKSSADLTSTELVVFITPRIVRSPEDMEKAKSAQPGEVALTISGVGERIIVNKLFEEASELERDQGLISRGKDKETRMSDAMDHYKQILAQFPQSDKADDALYRQGIIAYDYYRDLDMARELFSRLVENYKDSSYVGMAKKRLERIKNQTEEYDKWLFRRQKRDTKK